MLLNKNKNPFLVLIYYLLGPVQALFLFIVVFVSYKNMGVLLLHEKDGNNDYEPEDEECVSDEGETNDEQDGQNADIAEFCCDDIDK